MRHTRRLPNNFNPRYVLYRLLVINTRGSTCYCKFTAFICSPARKLGSPHVRLSKNTRAPPPTAALPERAGQTAIPGVTRTTPTNDPLKSLRPRYRARDYAYRFGSTGLVIAVLIISDVLSSNGNGVEER